MSGWVVLCVAVGGALGAVLRWLADAAGRRWSPSVAETGVLVANVAASGLLGWLAAGDVLLGPEAVPAAATPSPLAAPVLGWQWWLLGAGLAGALSTWSTAVVQVVRRWRAGDRSVALVLAVATWLLAAGAARCAATLSVAAPTLPA
ncbi:CrcB family protein [Kytococcus sp. Marseille-QA3725]